MHAYFQHIRTFDQLEVVTEFATRQLDYPKLLINLPELDSLKTLGWYSDHLAFRRFEAVSNPRYADWRATTGVTVTKLTDELTHYVGRPVCEFWVEVTNVKLWPRKAWDNPREITSDGFTSKVGELMNTYQSNPEALQALKELLIIQHTHRFQTGQKKMVHQLMERVEGDGTVRLNELGFSVSVPNEFCVTTKVSLLDLY